MSTSRTSVSNKNVGAFLAFNQEFFNKHQKTLIRLLNYRLTRRWFRWILRIRKHDCPLATRISEVGPNRFSFGDCLVNVNGRWRFQRTTDFRTHPKFGKRIYYAFRPVWWLLHFWDWAVADRFIPQWSYGFSTLTVYPNPDTESTSVDGWAARSVASETFGTIRAGAGNNNQDNSASIITYLEASTTTNQYTWLSRGLVLFDTSALTSGATISAAVFSVWGSVKQNGLGSPDFHLAGSTPASNTAVAAADYGQCQTTSFGNIAYASYVSNSTQYDDLTLNVSGLAAISKTSITKFSTQISWDINNSFGGSWASSQRGRFDFLSADTAGTANDPKLVITSTTPTDYTSTLTESATITNILVKATTRILSQVLTITDTLTTLRARFANLIESFTITNVLLKLPARILAESFAVNLASVATLINSYSESNQNSGYNTYAGGWPYRGQGFINADGRILDSCKWYLRKGGSPTGNIVATLYAHTGTYGTNGKPTGSALATSDAVDISTLTGSFQLITFNFSGGNRIPLVVATNYVIVMSFTGGDVSNYLDIGVDTTSPTHSGNESYSLDGSSWSTDTGGDLCFYVYGLGGFAGELSKSTTRPLPETAIATASLLRDATRNITESLTMTATALKTATRNIIESFSLTDIFASAKILIKTYTESFTLSDTVTKSSVRTILESFSLTDILAAVRSLFTTLLESFTASDIINRAVNRIASEVITITDILVSLKAKVAEFIESFAVTDTLNRSITRLLSEAAAISDVLTSIRLYLRTLTEQFSLIDVFSRMVNFFRTFTESFAVIDRITQYLNGWLVQYTDKFINQATIFFDKFTGRGTSSSDKFSERGTSSTDKYHKQ